MVCGWVQGRRCSEWGVRRRQNSSARAVVALHSLLDPPCAGCPIYTRGEVIGDTLVHCVGVPFVYWAATLLVETATQRLGNVRARAPCALLHWHCAAVHVCRGDYTPGEPARTTWPDRIFNLLFAPCSAQTPRRSARSRGCTRTAWAYACVPPNVCERALLAQLVAHDS